LGRVEYRGELIQRSGRSRFLAFRVEPGHESDKAGRCRLPPLADLWGKGLDAKQPLGSMTVAGWAFSEFIGVAKVQVLLDGTVRAEARYGLEAEKVSAQWPTSNDPHHPRVGFEATVDTSALSPGPHRFQVRVTDAEGRVRDLLTRTLEFGDR
jgi:hypothetical protein